MQIVYYSLSGSTEKIAQTMSTQLGLPLCRIEDVSSRKGLFHFIRSGFEATFKICPRIKTTNSDNLDPEHVVLLAPIWASRICSPLRTFCKQNAGRFRTFSLVLTHLDPQNKYEGMKSEVAALTGARCQVFESFCSKTVRPADIQALCKRLTEL